jgi:hypothetical protein
LSAYPFDDLFSAPSLTTQLESLGKGAADAAGRASFPVQILIKYNPRGTHPVINTVFLDCVVLIVMLLTRRY